MADTYTDSLRLVQQVNGENDGTWGDLIDAALQMVEDATADVRSITQSSTSLTLTTNNNADDQARAAVLDFSGSPTGTATITIPDKDKIYLISNACDQALTFTKGSGTTYTMIPGARAIVYVKGGTGVFPISDEITSENLVINGAMGVSVRGTSFATLTASQYTLDRWEWIDTGTTAGVVTITQDSDAPTVAQAGFNFVNSLKIDVTTAEDIASGDAALYLSHKIEAQNCTAFGHGATGALDGILQFWFKSTKTGIFTVNVDRNDATEKYSTEFTVGTTNTWEKFQVTIPGDTSGTVIADDVGVGLTLQFMLAVGATGKTSTADAWNASGSTELATTNQVNLLDNAANNVLITGVQFNIGSQTKIFEQEDFERTLKRCHRYFQDVGKEGNNIFGHGSTRTTSIVDYIFGFRTTMRAAPSLITSGTASDYSVTDATGAGGGACTSVPSVVGAGTDVILLGFTKTTHGLTGNEVARVLGSASGTLFLSAEL